MQKHYTKRIWTQARRSRSLILNPRYQRLMNREKHEATWRRLDNPSRRVPRSTILYYTFSNKDAEKWYISDDTYTYIQHTHIPGDDRTNRREEIAAWNAKMREDTFSCAQGNRNLGVIFNALPRIYDTLHGRHSRDVHASCHASLWRSTAESEHLRLSEYQSESRSSRNNSSSNNVRLVPCLRRVFIVA